MVHLKGTPMITTLAKRMQRNGMIGRTCRRASGIMTALLAVFVILFSLPNLAFASTGSLHWAGAKQLGSDQVSLYVQQVADVELREDWQESPDQRLDVNRPVCASPIPVVLTLTRLWHRDAPPASPCTFKPLGRGPPILAVS